MSDLVFFEDVEIVAVGLVLLLHHPAQRYGSLFLYDERYAS